MTLSNLDIRPYEPGDEHAILALFELVFGRPLPESWWRWRFLENPSGPGVIELAWAGDVLAGHYAVSAAQQWFAGAPVETGLSGTTMTHPDHRGIGLFPELARRVYSRGRDEGMQLVWGFPNDASHRGFIQDLGWRDVYEIPTFRAQVLQTPRLQASPEGFREVNEVDARFDRLWDRTREEADDRGGMLALRSSAHLRWRLDARSGVQYRILVAEQGEDLVGYVAFSQYGSELQIVDLSYAGDVDVGVRLVGNVAMIAREEQGASVALWLNVADPLHRALEKLGFSNGERITYLAGLGLSEEWSPPEYRTWWICMSDSDVY